MFSNLFPSAATIRLLLLIGGIPAYWFASEAAMGQVKLSYGSVNSGTTQDSSTQDGNVSPPRNYVELGYGLPLSKTLTLTPSFGFLNDESSPVTTLTDPSGYKLGLWAQYDLLAYSAGHAYAQGGLTYLDFDLATSASSQNGNELQFALGVGADLEIGKNVSAFTNLNYILSGETSLDLLNLSTPATGLEVGVEITF